MIPGCILPKNLIDTLANLPTVKDPPAGPTKADPKPPTTTTTIKPITADDAMKVLRGVVDTGASVLGEFKSVGKTLVDSLPSKPYAGPPILGTFQSERAQKKLADMDPVNRFVFTGLQAAAQSPQEQEYLLKALAAGHSVSEIADFAKEIRGKSPEWMHNNLRLTGDADGTPGLKQQWSMSCGPTTTQVIHGELDPIYALSVHKDNADIHGVDPQPDASIWDQIKARATGKPLGEHSMADEQADILTNGGGTAIERGKNGGKGMGLPDALQTLADRTGVTYNMTGTASSPVVAADAGVLSQLVGRALDIGAASSNAGVFAKLDADLAKGIPAGIRVSDAANSGGHFVAVTGSFGQGEDKTYVLHDPMAGQTVYVKASDLQQGKIIPKIAGWDTLSHVYTTT
jgi:hypothetical protein